MSGRSPDNVLGTRPSLGGTPKTHLVPCVLSPSQSGGATKHILSALLPCRYVDHSENAPHTASAIFRFLAHSLTAFGHETAASGADKNVGVYGLGKAKRKGGVAVFP